MCFRGPIAAEISAAALGRLVLRRLRLQDHRLGARGARHGPAAAGATLGAPGGPQTLCATCKDIFYYIISYIIEYVT